MLRPEIVTGPAEQPISLTEAKAHLRVEHSADDDLIGSLIEAATKHLDGSTGVLRRALLSQTWKQSFPRFSSRMRLALDPVQSIAAITYVDLAGVDQPFELAGARVLKDSNGPFVCITGSTPSTDVRPDAVSITYVAGFGDTPAEVPQSIRQAIKLLVGHYYASREAVAPSRMAALPLGVRALLEPHGRISL